MNTKMNTGMNTAVNWRVAGIALLVGCFGAVVALQSAGSPGGEYSASAAATYADPGGYLRPIFAWTAAALAMLALPFFGYALRGIGGWAGEIIWALSVAAAGVGVTGAYFAGGFIVSLAESGGTAIHDGTSTTLVYTFAEMGNLLAVTAPMFLIGAAGLLVAWKGGLPGWLRVITVIGGLCAMAEPWYFPIPGVLLWVLSFGIWSIVRGGRRRQPLPKPVFQGQGAIR